VPHDLLDHRRVRPAPGGGVEVDDVQPAEAQAGPLARGAERVVEAHLLVGVLAADELDAGAVAEVDGGEDDHRGVGRRERAGAPVGSDCTHAATSATPGPLDFSGWNCTPTALCTRTAAGKRSPSCSLHAVTCASAAPAGRQTKLLA
jgi:hypothetical protein